MRALPPAVASAESVRENWSVSSVGEAVFGSMNQLPVANHDPPASVVPVIEVSVEKNGENASGVPVVASTMLPSANALTVAGWAVVQLPKSETPTPVNL